MPVLVWLAEVLVEASIAALVAYWIEREMDKSNDRDDEDGGEDDS